MSNCKGSEGECEFNGACMYNCGEVLNIDLITAAVRKDLLDRSTLGIKKYGTTLDRNSGDLRYWLNHAYEEALDHAQYLKRAIMEIDKTNGNT